MKYKMISILADILKIHGKTVCNKPEYLAELLKESSPDIPDSNRQIHLIITALKEGVPQELINNAKDEMRTKYYLVERLTNQLSLDKKAAEWVVNGWWKALWTLVGGYFCPDTGMEFSYVKGGTYLMGDIFGDGNPDEQPIHKVELDDFYIGRYAVTQDEWQQIMHQNPSYCGGVNVPVERVTWTSCNEFIFKLNKVSSIYYRLPTEAEWEYAARSGGENEKFSGSNNASEVAHFGQKEVKNSIHGSVADKKPNGFGCYSMSGNIWEWCYDYYDENYYQISPKKNPKGPTTGTFHVCRGGSWRCEESDVRCFSRYYGEEDRSQFSDLGVRLAFTPNHLDNAKLTEGDNEITEEIFYFSLSKTTVLDSRTNLMWVRNTDLFGFDMTREEAGINVADLKYAGFNDWRLPTVNEMKVLDEYNGNGDRLKYLLDAGFYGLIQRHYWTSDTREMGVTYLDDGDYFGFAMGYSVYNVPKTIGRLFNKDVKLEVWPVRDVK